MTYTAGTRQYGAAKP